MEEKGFTFQDKRRFSMEEEEKKEEKKVSEPKREEEKAPLLEVNFSSFIFSLNNSVLLHFGIIPDPVSQKLERNLSLAKQTIDLIGMLKEKTKGNLTENEERLIDAVLYDLRIRYVEEVKKG